MTVEEALATYLEDQGRIDKGLSPRSVYKRNWFMAEIAGVQFPFFPMLGFRQGILIHDAHHMLCGYETNWTGESELAGWELASGGCADHVFFWADRILFLFIAIWIAPVRLARAFRAGWGQRNLYRLNRETVLAMDLEEARLYMVS